MSRLRVHHTFVFPEARPPSDAAAAVTPDGDVADALKKQWLRRRNVVRLHRLSDLARSVSWHLRHLELSQPDLAELASAVGQDSAIASALQRDEEVKLAPVSYCRLLLNAQMATAALSELPLAWNRGSPIDNARALLGCLLENSCGLPWTISPPGRRLLSSFPAADRAARARPRLGLGWIVLGWLSDLFAMLAGVALVSLLAEHESEILAAANCGIIYGAVRLNRALRRRCAECRRAPAGLRRRA